MSGDVCDGGLGVGDGLGGRVWLWCGGLMRGGCNRELEGCGGVW